MHLCPWSFVSLTIARSSRASGNALHYCCRSRTHTHGWQSLIILLSYACTRLRQATSALPVSYAIRTPRAAMIFLLHPILIIQNLTSPNVTDEI